jgi:hypothetical protein
LLSRTPYYPESTKLDHLLAIAHHNPAQNQLIRSATAETVKKNSVLNSPEQKIKNINNQLVRQKSPPTTTLSSLLFRAFDPVNAP